MTNFECSWKETINVYYPSVSRAILFSEDNIYGTPKKS